MSQVRTPNPIGVSDSALASARPLRSLGRDVIEVRGLAANYRSDSNDSMVALGLEEPARSDGKLPCSWNPDDIDILEEHTVLEQRLERAVDELLYDWLIEAAGEHGHAPPDAARQSRKLCHLRREEVPELRALGFEVA